MFPRWLTFLAESNGKTLSENNGVITSTNVVKPLEPTADIGDVKIAWQRDRDMIGIIRNFTFAIALFRTAAKIARNEFYKKNIERKIFFILTKLTLDYNTATTPAIYKRYYSALYRGEVDMTTIKDSDYKITFNLIDGGIAQTLKAKRDTVYEIPMDDQEAILVKMDGVELMGKFNFSIYGTTTITKTHLLPVVFLNGEGANINLAVNNSAIIPNVVGSGYQTTSPDFFLLGFGQTTIHLKGQVRIVFGQGTTYSLVLRTSKNRTLNIFSGPITVPAYDISYDVSFVVNADENVFFEGTTNGNIAYGESSFTVSFVNKYKTTYIKAFLPETVNRKLVQKMTGDSANTSSTLIQANNNLALTCMNAVRSLPGSVMKTKYSDFLKFTKVQMVAGVGVEGEKIVIEGVDHFYNQNDIEDLGEVKNLEITVDKESMANTFDVGYTEQTYDDVNGKFEFNNTHSYESSITRVVNKYDLVCPYRADSIGIELLRIRLAGQDTTDNDSDNDVCILDIDLANPQTDPVLGKYYNLRRIIYDNFNDPTDFGVPSPATVFNVEIRPEKLLEKHRKWIDGMMYGFEGDKLFYTTTEKNTIRTKKGNTVIDGKADYVISTNRYFIPRLLGFDSDIDADIIRRMVTQTNRCFRIVDEDGTVYTGFIDKIGVEPNTLKEQPFSLISTPTNNFLNRIR